MKYTSMMHQGGGHKGGHWKSSLTDEQKTKHLALKLKLKKKLYPLKLKIRQAKVELALLIGSDKPGQSAISKKISTLVKLKEQKMLFKASYKVAVRKLLKAEQKVVFDLYLLKKAYKGKKRRGSYGRHH